MAKRKTPAEVREYFERKLPDDVREFFVQAGRKGAKAQSAAMTPEQRRARAKLAAAARWKDTSGPRRKKG